MRRTATVLLSSVALVTGLPAVNASAATSPAHGGAATVAAVRSVTAAAASTTAARKVTPQLAKARVATVRKRTFGRRFGPAVPLPVGQPVPDDVPVAPRAAAPVAAPAVPVLPVPAPTVPVEPPVEPPVELSVPTTPPAPSALPVGPGAPSTTERGSFVERPCTRTYPLELESGELGDPAANGDRMRAVLDAAQSGDCITVAPGHYRLAGNVVFGVPGITLKGLGQAREDVWFQHTTETRASFDVKAADVHLYNFTHRVLATARSSQGGAGEGNIWVRGGHSGFRMQDVLAWGSRDAAVFLFGVHHFELNRVESRDSMSDAFHVNYGSSHGTFYDSVSRNSGDDGLGFVGYGAEGAETPHHLTVVRHHVDGQTWGRGIGLIHVNNISFYGPTLIERTAGAGVLLARESMYGSGSVRAIRFYGELRIRQANHHGSIDHGAIHINNPSTDAPIEDVLFTGPVVLVDTGQLNPWTARWQIRAHGAGPIAAEIGPVSFYGVGPADRLSLALAPGSYVTPSGWSATTPYGVTEPVFPLT